MVEVVTGLLFLWTMYSLGLSVETLQYTVVIGLMIPICLIDFEHLIIPDRLNFGIFLAALITFFIGIYTGSSHWSELADRGLGLLLGGGFFLFIAVVTKGAMGGGDIKLMAALGFLFGVSNTFVLMFFSFVLGGILSVILLLLKIRKRKDYVPFGPFICLAAFITIFWGDQILQWYLF